MVAHANPGGFPPGARTAAATTTPAYIGNGSATTTVVYDAYNINGTNQQTTGLTTDTDSATLLVQFVGSSTSAVLTTSFEYSQDGVDWYLDSTNDDNTISTTSTVVSLNQPNKYVWTYAALPTGGAAGTAATTTRAITVATPTRYVRAVFSLSGAAGAVWAQFVPKKQQP